MDDVEEIPFDEHEDPAKPERDFQPPRVNTFFEAGADDTTAGKTAVPDKKVRKEQRKIKKALQAINDNPVKKTQTAQRTE